MAKISFVIPCYRSEKTIRDVYNEILSTVKAKEEYSYEVVAVNDCSPDQVLDVLLDIAGQDKQFIVIDCAKNMGKHAALMAGFRHSSGDIVVCLDDDGQCPLDHLWELIEPLNNGYDVSMAQYGRKKQSNFKNIGSYGNELMMRWMLGKPKNFQFANFAAFKKFVVEEMCRYTNAYSYVNGLVLRSTIKYTNVPMEERCRAAGTGGYTFSKSLKLWINGMTAFSVRPLRIATGMGIFSFIAGLVFGILALFGICPFLFAIYFIIFLLAGMMMLLIGLIGEYIGRTYMCINNEPQYVIRQVWNYRDGNDRSN
ncbi:MAG: glycosyltransferase [Clostridiales bacterium]|nr:glycosyltransferase [Clostridiales bacterium]